MLRPLARLLAGVFASLLMQEAFGAPTMPPKAEAALKLGLAAAQKQDWAAALTNFQNALTLAPTATQIAFDLGLANDKMGGHQFAALAWYRAYLALLPDAARPAKLVARVAALEAQEVATEQALISRAKAVNRQVPVNIQLGGLEQIANAEATMGQSAAALKTIADASNDMLAGPRGNFPLQMWLNSAKGNRDNAYMQLTTALTKANDLASARIALGRISGINPYAHDRRAALANISEALADAGRFGEAALYAQKVTGISREFTFQHLGEAQFQKGDRAAAKLSLDKAVATLDGTNCKQYDCIYVGAQLLPSLGKIQGLAAAQHLYDRLQHLATSRTIVSMNIMRENYASLLANAGRIAEAKALAARISGGNKPGSIHALALSLIASAETSQINTRINVLNAQLAAAHDLASIKAAVVASALPVDLQTFPAWLHIADLYGSHDDGADAQHVVQLLQKALIREPPTLNRANAQLDLAQAFLGLHQNKTAAALVSHLTVAPFLPAILRQHDPYHQAEALATQLAKMAAWQAKADDLRNARISAQKAMAIFTHLNLATVYGNDLVSLCTGAPRLALEVSCEALAARLPPGSNRDSLYGTLIGAQVARLDGAGRQAALSKINQLMAKIDNKQQRENSLQLISQRLATAADWQDAIKLAAGAPGPAAALAQQMIANGNLRQAASLVPQFSTNMRLLVSYEAELALHLARMGDINGALAAMQRITDASFRVTPLYQIARTAFTWGGPDAKLAAAAADATFTDFYARPNFGCWTLAQITPSSVPAWNKPDLATDMQKCLSLRASWMLVNTQWRCCHSGPDMPKALRHAYQQERFWVDRNVLAKVQSTNAGGRAAADRNSIGLLYGDGALELANSQFTGHPNEAMSDAAQRLGEDNPAAAHVLAARLIARAAPLKAGYAKSQLLVEAMNGLLASGDLGGATALLSQITYQYALLPPLRQLSRFAQTAQSADAASLLTQEVQKDHEENQDYYLADVPRRALELGLQPLAKLALARYLVSQPQGWCAAEYGYSAGLLEHGERARAIVRLKAALERMAALEPTSRTSCAIELATALAWAGQNDLLADLLAKAPDADVLARDLRGAARGAARVGDPVAARQFLTRALAARKSQRQDFAGWSAALMAEAQAAIDPTAAAKAALAIADPVWRGRAVAKLAQARFALGDLDGATKLLEDSAPLHDRVLDMGLARAARWLYGQGHSQRGRILIGRISAKTLREATWHFCLLTGARLHPDADPLLDSDQITNPAERAFLLIDLCALLQSQHRADLASKALQQALALTSQIGDALVKADVAVWVTRLAAADDSTLMKSARSAASTITQTLPDRAVRAAMRQLLQATLDLTLPAAPGSQLAMEAEQNARDRKIESDVFGFVPNLNYAQDLGDTAAYLRMVASKNPEMAVGELTGAAVDRAAKLASLHTMVKSWRITAASKAAP